jgi:hypothetical protein
MSVFDGNTPRRNVEPWPEDRVPTNNLERLIASATPYIKKERDEAERARADADSRCRAEGGNTSNNNRSNLAAKAPAAHADDTALNYNAGLVRKGIRDAVAAHALQPAATTDAQVEKFWSTYNDATALHSMIDATKKALAAAGVAAPTAGAAPAESKDRRILLDTVGDLAEALLKVRDWVSSNPEAVSYINKAIACAGIRSSAGAATTSEDARDAARYRWLREQPYETFSQIAFNTWNNAPFVFPYRDQFIDAAMRTTQQEGGNAK